VSEDFWTFEKVMRELQMEEDELKRLVSAGELRAFRVSDQMKFKKEDIDSFKGALDDSEPDVIELLDGDDTVDTGAGDSTGDDLTQELVFEDSEFAGDDDSDVGMATAPIMDDELFGDDTAKEAASEEEEGENLFGDAGEEEFLDDDAVVAGKTPIRKSRIGGAEEEVVEGPAFLGMMVLSSIVLIIGVIVVVDIATSDPSPMVEWLVGMFKEK